MFVNQVRSNTLSDVRPTRRNPRGQSMVELALTLPMLLLLFLGLVEVSYYLYAANTVHYVARESARVASKESRSLPKTINEWSTIVISSTNRVATAGFLAPTSVDDTVITSFVTTDATGAIASCAIQKGNWPADNQSGPDVSKFTCVNLSSLVTQMSVDLGVTLNNDKLIVVEYYHHHYPLIGLTVVAPNGITLYSYTAMRIIGE